MKFSQAVPSGFQNYSSIEGRASRSAFWNWMLFYFLGLAAAELLDNIMFYNRSMMDPFFSYPIRAFFGLAMLVPNVAVSVRRLHDVNRAGPWLFLFPTIIGIIPLLLWACQEGTRGPNAFGPDPVAAAAEEAKKIS